MFHIGGDAGDQATSADRDKDRIDRIGVLTQDLHGHGSLPCDHIEVIVGMDQAATLLVTNAIRKRRRLVVSVSFQHGFASETSDGVDFDSRRRPRHHDA